MLLAFFPFILCPLCLLYLQPHPPCTLEKRTSVDIVYTFTCKDCTRVRTVIPYYAVHGLLHAHLSTPRTLHPNYSPSIFSLAPRGCARWFDLISITFIRTEREALIEISESYFRRGTTTWQPMTIVPYCYRRLHGFSLYTKSGQSRARLSRWTTFLFYPPLFFFFLFCGMEHVLRSLTVEQYRAIRAAIHHPLQLNPSRTRVASTYRFVFEISFRSICIIGHCSIDIVTTKRNFRNMLNIFSFYFTILHVDSTVLQNPKKLRFLSNYSDSFRICDLRNRIL